MNLPSKIKAFTAKGGWILAFLRLPRIVIIVLLTRLNTFYWRLFLGSMGKNVTISLGVDINLPAKVFIADGVIIGKGVEIGSECPEGRLFIEKNVQINQRCIIDHSGDLTIGEGTLISAETVIFTHSHGYNPRNKPLPMPKKIGRNCWIGFRSLIGENATQLADHTIIAAGSMVVKPCNQPHVIYGGTPAKILKEIKYKEGNIHA